ncbi:MAG: hypothetical protein AseanaTS_24820 [Candidatus Pelagadaptatus aseana]
MYGIQANDFNQWRRLARGLLQRRISPQQLHWESPDQTSLLLTAASDDYLAQPVITDDITIPRDFFTLAKQVACFRDPSRWSLLYSLAWRLVFQDRSLLGNKIDPEVARLLAMRKAVGRDKHKMEAFVRFQQVQEATADQPEVFVAWFEPEHLILPITAPFFAKRFSNMVWTILTPDACAHWDGQQLQFSPGVTRPPARDDAVEDLWREYYANIFNPARLKLKAMQSEMPKKYWVNLPEAPLIAELTRNAGKHTEAMLAKSATPEWKKTAKSRFIKQQQKLLRHRSDDVDG